MNGRVSLAVSISGENVARGYTQYWRLNHLCACFLAKCLITLTTWKQDKKQFENLSAFHPRFALAMYIFQLNRDNGKLRSFWV